MKEHYFSFSEPKKTYGCNLKSDMHDNMTIAYLARDVGNNQSKRTSDQCNTLTQKLIKEIRVLNRIETRNSITNPKIPYSLPFNT